MSTACSHGFVADDSPVVCMFCREDQLEARVAGLNAKLAVEYENAEQAMRAEEASERRAQEAEFRVAHLVETITSAIVDLRQGKARCAEETLAAVVPSISSTASVGGAETLGDMRERAPVGDLPKSDTTAGRGPETGAFPRASEPQPLEIVGVPLNIEAIRELSGHPTRTNDARPCGAYLGDNDGTCPQLTCLRGKGHEGAHDNMNGDAPHTNEETRHSDEARRRQFEPVNAILHRLWSREVGTPCYIKSDWQALEAAIYALVPRSDKAETRVAEYAGSLPAGWNIFQSAPGVWSVCGPNCSSHQEARISFFDVAAPRPPRPETPQKMETP